MHARYMYIPVIFILKLDVGSKQDEIYSINYVLYIKIHLSFRYWYIKVHNKMYHIYI